MGSVNDTQGLSFYKAVSDANINAGNRIMIVVDGDHAGEKAILSEGGFSWKSAGEGFISRHGEELKRSADGVTGIIEADGTRVYTELLGGEKHIVICGAGHVSMPVITIGKMIGCRVTVIDDRLAFTENAIRRGADEAVFKNFGDALADIPGSEDTYFVIVTRGHRYDRECLRCIAGKPHAYIGLMGSRRRVAIVKSELESEGISRDLLDSVHTPIGLDIGGETPEEIAVSIMAEIIEVKNRKKRGLGFPRDIMKAILEEDRERLTLATIISKKGAAPRDAGTRMLVAGDGSITGTIGGGCIEGKVIAKGRRMLLGSGCKPEVIEVDMTAEAAEDEGMVCGGTVQVLLEVV